MFRHAFRMILVMAMACSLVSETYAQKQKPDKGHVLIIVPEGAKVFVKGDSSESEMKVNKNECQFSSSNNLDPNQPGYSFRVRVTYSTQGQEFSETRKVRVFAGLKTTVNLIDIASPNKRLRTLQYWVDAMTICYEWSPRTESISAKDYISCLKRASQELDSLPVRKVDEDVVAVFQDISNTFMKFATYIEENDGYSRVVESFVRGFFGDPLGVALEMTAEQKALRSRMIDNIDKIKKLKAVLTARYDIEFPG